MDRVWINFFRDKDIPHKIGSLVEEEQLKGLAEKFTTYFNGTFQCDIGHEVSKNKNFSDTIYTQG